ncbi:hypothetical protein J6590_086573 [Homalodisca vitripennis]|nr:hypothetical protein J6590_086573 [Homalodisca vitripennis]
MQKTLLHLIACDGAKCHSRYTRHHRGAERTTSQLLTVQLTVSVHRAKVLGKLVCNLCGPLHLHLSSLITAVMLSTTLNGNMCLAHFSTSQRPLTVCIMKYCCTSYGQAVFVVCLTNGSRHT